MVYPAIPLVLAMVAQARLVAAVMEAEVAGMAAEAINATDRGDPNKSVLCLCHSPFLDSF